MLKQASPFGKKINLPVKKLEAYRYVQLTEEMADGNTYSRVSEAVLLLLYAGR